MEGHDANQQYSNVNVQEKRHEKDSKERLKERRRGGCKRKRKKSGTSRQYLFGCE